MKKYTQKTYSSHNVQETVITLGKKTVAFTSYCYIPTKAEVGILSLFTDARHRDSAFMDMLLAEIEHYAESCKAKQIKAYCGPEPMSPDGQMPLEDEVAWYKSKGFTIQDYVYGIVPIAIKHLSPS